MANDNSRKFKHNQIMFSILPCIVAVSYTHLLWQKICQRVAGISVPCGSSGPRLNSPQSFQSNFNRVLLVCIESPDNAFQLKVMLLGWIKSFFLYSNQTGNRFYSEDVASETEFSTRKKTVVSSSTYNYIWSLNSTTPVSYTHLDVYKRQHIYTFIVYDKLLSRLHLWMTEFEYTVFVVGSCWNGSRISY